MGEVVRRVWKSGPRKVRRVAWGYTLQLDGKQVRITSSAWTEEDAETALAARLLGLETPKKEPKTASGMTLDTARQRYLEAKEAEKKRSLRDDRLNLARLVRWFGADTLLAAVTAARIAEYRTTRAKEKSRRRVGEQTVSAATVNRELAVLRHLLHLAADEWQVIDKAPMVRLLREPEGRIRWLEPDEEARLLAACGEPLRSIVKVAMETGMRQGEILTLTWERVDLTRGVFKLERTKSGRRREVPMRQEVYELLATKPEPRSGRVWSLARFPRAMWEAAVIEAKLDDFHFHDTRHHFASWFMMRGGTLPALREILGHRDIKMTLRYAHLAPAHLRVEIERTAAASAQAQHNGGRIDPAARVSV